MSPTRVKYVLPGLLLWPLYSWGLSYEAPSISPEVESGYEEKPGWSADSFAVAAANPLATDAGYQCRYCGADGAKPRRAPVEWHWRWRFFDALRWR